MILNILGTRWFEPKDDLNPRDANAVKSMDEWLQLGTTREDFAFSAEMFFPAQHQDGRYGVLYEIELDDDFTPSQKQIEDAKNCAVAPGEFEYVPPGDHDKTWNGRAAYWVFFPGRFFNIKALEETARRFDLTVA